MGLLRLGKDNWARTSPTKEGIVFLGLSLFVGFAALNTGNNLLYLAFGMMLSFIVASGVMSMINLARIEVSVKPSGDSFAASPSKLKFFIRNGKYLIPSYSISIELEGEKVFIPYLPAKKESVIGVSYLFRRRGWNTIPEARLSTRFPFGFFKKWIRVDAGGEDILVYPRLQNVSLDNENIKKNPEDTKPEPEGSGRERSSPGEDIRSLKEYSPGDNPKLIHWKTTAKAGRLMVREIEEDADNKEAVLRFIPHTDNNMLEREISRVASTFIELLKRGYEVEFVSPERKFSTSRSGRSPRPVLTYLALFDG